MIKNLSGKTGENIQIVAISTLWPQS
jgi:hypothetical protein